MNQEPPVPPPVDPWADATETESETETEQLTPPVSYPPSPWGADPGIPRQPGPVRPADLITNIPEGGGRRAPVAVLAVVIVILLLAAGVVLGKALAARHGGGSGPGALGTTGTTQQPAGPATGLSPGGTIQASAGSPGTAASGTAPADPAIPANPASPGATSGRPSGRPGAPDEALALTPTQAVTELGIEADESGPAVATLAGFWVPQVDGKCVGVGVDIQPSFVPDGTPDTPHVTVQQILAFHLSLHSRFGALTVRQSQLGIGADTATSGPCAGQVIWNSVVPQTFGAPQDANKWCDVNMPPVHECLARYVAKPGEVSKAVERG